MTTSNPTIVVIGQGPVAEAIPSRFSAGARGVITLPHPDAGAIKALENGLDAAVIVAPPAPSPSLLLDIDDARLDAQLSHFTDLFEALGALLGRLNPKGAIVLVGDRGYLGAWGAADACAFSGAYVALMRCVTLEGFGAGHRANCIALDLAQDGAGVDPDEIADLAVHLASPAGQAINGEIILANRGRSLRVREAKDRRADFAKTAPSKGTSQ
ncbi:MAG: SDR family NAD(P)-dependent oxidoreductase [Proteobacteria bacterium]|nr:SDR family NAD(P)-dependent oxidoreductase [Pseudomonadota bacterium]